MSYLDNGNPITEDHKANLPCCEKHGTELRFGRICDDCTKEEEDAGAEETAYMINEAMKHPVIKTTPEKPKA